MAAQRAFTAWSVFDPEAISFLIGCFLQDCMRVFISCVLLSVGSREGFQRAKSSRKLINSSRVHVFVYHTKKQVARVLEHHLAAEVKKQWNNIQLRMELNFYITRLSRGHSTWSVGVLVWFVSLVSPNPCRRMGFHKGEAWTWDIFPSGSSLTVRISGMDSNSQISAFQSIIEGWKIAWVWYHSETDWNNFYSNPKYV